MAPDGREQVALSDGYRRIRIDVARGTVLEGPVRLEYLLGGFGDVDTRILTLRRLISLHKSGRFARGLFPAERLAPKWLAALRTCDAVRAGATQSDIARALFGERFGSSGRREGSDFLRLRVQRLVRKGRSMIQGGYRTLLRSDIPRSNLASRL